MITGPDKYNPAKFELDKTKRNIKYFWITVSGALLFFGFSVLFYFTSDYGWIQSYHSIFCYKISIGFFTALLTAAGFQYIRIKLTDENLKTDIKMAVYDGIELHDKDRDIFSPFRIYNPYTDDGDTAINNLLTSIKVQHVNFLGMSGNYFFKERLQKNKDLLYPRVQFQLLLHDPQDSININARAAQMEYEYDKKVTGAELRSQIIIAIVKAIYIRSQLVGSSFHIKFHSEKPDYRLEFYGEHDLFVSFFKSGKLKEQNEKGAGPMAHYKRDVNSFMYDVYQNTFYKAWKSVTNSRREIIINDETNFSLKNLSQTTTEDSVNKAIAEIIGSREEEHEFKEWLKSQIIQNELKK